MVTDLMGIGELSGLMKARHISFTPNSGFSSVAIDSRAVKEGALFFALTGSSNDGHKFVNSAFASGAKGAVVASSKLDQFDLINAAQKAGKDLIVVENTLKGLQDAARVYLEKFPNLKKVGITGSSGKPNEILEITEVLKPNIASITNIGSAHIEYFGSKSKIVNEKKCIFSFLKNNDIALIPANDEYADELAEGVTGKTVFYGYDNFKEFKGARSLGMEGTEIIWAGEKVRFALPGKHSLDDAIAAIAIAKEIPVSDNAIIRGLESVKPLFGRLEILNGKRATVIRDCYNANPESAAKSVEFCDLLEWPGRKVYVIADMLELGGSSVSEHEKLGFNLSVSSARKVFLFGNEIKAAVRNMEDNGKSFFYSSDINELSTAIDGYVKKGDLVLLKGSRGCALERLSEMLTGVSNVS